MNIMFTMKEPNSTRTELYIVDEFDSYIFLLFLSNVLLRRMIAWVEIETYNLVDIFGAFLYFVVLSVFKPETIFEENSFPQFLIFPEYFSRFLLVKCEIFSEIVHYITRN